MMAMFINHPHQTQEHVLPKPQTRRDEQSAPSERYRAQASASTAIIVWVPRYSRALRSGRVQDTPVSVGLIASMANLLLLRQSVTTKAQLRFWDKWMVPASKVLDPFFRFSIGKSIIAVWRKV
jgi:hypothetical protein